MNDRLPEPRAQQTDLFEIQTTRALLDQLQADSTLYTQSKDYKDLPDSLVRPRSFNPLNSILPYLQKPGLSYPASGQDRNVRFGRRLKEGARPPSYSLAIRLEGFP